jgi:hypothetical protein
VMAKAKQLQFHPLCSIFPLMEGEEFDALVADIKAHGLHESIVLYEGKILDGRNRYRACAEAGVKVRVQEHHHGCAHIGDPRAYVISANIHRRHLTAEDKRDLIAKLIKAQPEKSNRQIAKTVKVDHKTVGAARAELEGRGEIPHVEERTDTKGRKQPAKKRRSKDSNPADDPKASADFEVVGYVDEDGNSIPEEKVKEERVGGPEAVAALEMVGRMSAESREGFFEELQERYPDDFGHALYEDQNDADVVRTIVEAIGADRARALGKKIPGLVLKAVGKVALPDCSWCKGSGLEDIEAFGGTKVPCRCTRRKRGEDFNMLQARLERENKEQGIPQQDFSFGLEVATKDGRVWASGVRLPTKEEAEFYIDYWARPELSKHGYVPWKDDPNTDLLAFDIKRYDEQPMMKIWGGKRKALSFMHGTCGLLGWKGWHPISGGECECKKCRKLREQREHHRLEVERLEKEHEIVERALAAGKISQEQHDEWGDLPIGKSPKWLAGLQGK